MVAQPSPKQAVGNSATFRDQRHLGKEDMQGSRSRTNQVAANKTLHLTAISLRSIAAGDLDRWAANDSPTVKRDLSTSKAQ